MKLIFVGSSRPEAIAQEYLRRGSRVNFAGMTLQNALLEGLFQHDNDLRVISSWVISPYPKVKQIFFQPENIEFKGRKDRYRFVGATNLPIINMLSKFFRIRKELKRQLKDEKKGNVIVYETYTPFLLAVATLRKRIAKAVVIVPDLPDYMHGSNNRIRMFFKNQNRNLINWCLKRFDGYVLLSEPMLEKLPIKAKSYIVMEGIFNPEFDEKPVEKEIARTIMYTGGVYSHRGTRLLLDAFKGLTAPNYRLWIRGDGDLKQEILDMAVKDPRITYFEPMGRKELLELERKATVMVNTTPSQDFTRYFFPSKNMEYLASGTPTIMFRLGCMPKEYDEYLYYVDGNDADALREKIIEVCEKSQEELNAFGDRARQFIIEKKNPFVQCKRILDFINTL